MPVSPLSRRSTRRRLGPVDRLSSTIEIQSSSVIQGFILTANPVSVNTSSPFTHNTTTSTFIDGNSRGNANLNYQQHLPNINTPMSVNQPKQKPKNKHSFNSPGLNLAITDDVLVQAAQKGHGILTEYIDHGDAIHVCSGCGVILWEAEMLRGNADRKKCSFSLCCKNGNVELPKPVQPPPLLMNLYMGQHPRSMNFMNNIRAYNMMFSFTSMSGKIDKNIHNSRGLFVFRLQGQNFHRIGSLLLPIGSPPKFSQLYMYDCENEVAHRLNAVSSSTTLKSRNTDVLDKDTIHNLKTMLDSCNPLVKSFRMVKDCLKENDWQNISLRLIANTEKDGRTYNLSTSPEIVGLIVGDIDQLVDKRDIIVRKTSGCLHIISELHPSYLAL